MRFVCVIPVPLRETGHVNKGKLARQKNAAKKIKAELVKLEVALSNFTEMFKNALIVGKAENPRVFTEQKTKNSGYSKLTFAEKLLAKFEAEFNKTNTNQSKMGMFSEGRVS